MTDTAPTVARLAAELRAGRTTSVQAVTQSLRRIDELNPTLNAFVLVDRAGALKAAATADAELAAGRDRGPLHGVPVSVKDIVEVAGWPTTCGSASDFGTRRADSDAEIVARLRRAGAVIVGKNTLHEFAYGATGDRSVHGPSRNPHDVERVSGGSSGGSAVAVASGMVPLSVGTDTAGSVRVPAALCGAVGFKPAFDALPAAGVYPLAPSLDHVGLFAADVADLALVYAALVGIGAMATDPVTVGWIPPNTIAPTDPRVETTVHDRVLAAGVQPVTVDCDPSVFDGLFDVFSTLQRAEAYDVHRHHLEQDRELIDDEVLARLRAGGDVSTDEYAAADEARTAFGRHVSALLEDYDVLVLPTTPIVAPRIGDRRVRVGGSELEVRAALLSLTSPWNLAGVPAISVPAGTVDGLPVGVQLVAAPGREAQLFSHAARLDATP